MIIFIKTPDDMGKINIKIEPYFSALINILTAYMEGKHIIIAERNLFELIYSVTDFDKRIRNAAKVAQGEQRQYRRLLKDVNTYIVADFSNFKSNSLSTDKNGVSTILVGCSFFSDSASVQNINLLCEDLSDTQFYIKVGEFYKDNINLEATRICFNPINGGGNNTYKSFETVVSNLQFCLCMLDSDKKHPEGNQGGTSLNFSGKNIPFNGRFVVINAHEAECLIPDEIIEILIIDKRYKHYDYSFSHRLNNLKSICTSDSRAKLFFDHKNGLLVNDVKKHDKTGGNPFWENTITNANGLTKTKCLRELQCNCKEKSKKKEKLECYVNHGFGSKLLEDSTVILNEMPNAKLAHILKKPLLDEWNNIGKEVFSWGCAPIKPARTS